MSAEKRELTYLGLFRYVKPYKWVFMLALLGAALDAAMQGAFAYMMKPILDGVFIERDSTLTRLIPFAIVGVFVIRGLGNFMASYGFTWVGRQVVNDFRRKVFQQYMVMPNTFYDQHSSGGLISRLTYDIEQMATGVSKNLIILIREFMAITVFLGVMMYHSFKLTLIVLIVFPFVALIINVINKRFRRIGHGIQDSIAQITEITGEVVRGQKIVKIFDGQADESERLEKELKKNRQLHVKIVATQEASSSTIHLMVAGALAVIVWIAIRETMSAGTFMSFMTAMLALLPAIKRISQIFSTIQKTMAAAESVFYILDQEAEKDNGTVELKAEEIQLSFKDTQFSYNAKETAALKGINLEVSAGTVCALVGPSGSGKTTLVNLVPRFYELNTGRIELNGHDVRDISLRSLRKHIAIVSQDVVLFNDTVSSNIAYGANANKSEQEIRAAAEKANALEFIEQLPEGFDTVLGDDGTRLSGGQRQRIAIARAILKDAPILILDEATSALDTESEKYIQDALEKVMQGKTTLVIAHRLSTIEHADQVVVMDQGLVKERGSHAELLAADGLYTQLQHMQKTV
ncbi:lipid A export permease/ATP-binding protein MsbA [Marinicella sp. W31]|uniref:lipid A export permease/ATP-binding protein MsbA n=1 Tax=Marinicella sp. W31 TaxID=3023713 RepID=UPI003757591D